MVLEAEPDRENSVTGGDGRGGDGQWAGKWKLTVSSTDFDSLGDGGQ